MIETMSALRDLMASYGATRLYAKKLSSNDNSKNQVYLGKDFSALNIIPFKDIYTDNSDRASSKRARAKAGISFSWVDEHHRHTAPAAQLILYPDYPEVRMSGFLQGCRNAPSEVMSARDKGRVLFLGMTSDSQVLGFVVGPEHPLAREIHDRTDLRVIGVFYEIPPDPISDTRAQLLAKLTEINLKHWILSSKLGQDGKAHPYKARNGGGYTLEAELGIKPNSYAEPDYLGWEIKQYGVRNFEQFLPKSPITLMTPEPTGGIYKEQGFEEFMQRYGYPDATGRPNRINFGGIYKCNGDYHKTTGLRLELIGYDKQTGLIGLDGGIALRTKEKECAAYWGLIEIVGHWKRKHAQAAYVPSLYRKPPPAYHFGPRVLLCEQTDLHLFVNAVSDGKIYYDPALKIEHDASGRLTNKRRNQFRIKFAHLEAMYKKTSQENLVSASVKSIVT